VAWGQFGIPEAGEHLPLEAVIWGLVKTQLTGKLKWVCETVTALLLIVVTSCKRSINPVTNLNPVHSQSNIWQYIPHQKSYLFRLKTNMYLLLKLDQKPVRIYFCNQVTLHTVPPCWTCINILKTVLKPVVFAMCVWYLLNNKKHLCTYRFLGDLYVDRRII
jgi:hypothetical protein